MAYRKGILLGRIIKASGYEGAVSVKLERTFTEDIPWMKPVFLEIDGRPVPFFISEYEYSGGDILKVKFDGYESVEKASEFTGCSVYLTETPQEADQDEEPENLEGYEVTLAGGRSIGNISRVLLNNSQWLLLVVAPDHRELLIPFHEDFIVSVDPDRRRIIMDIPEGLTEIN